MKKYSIVGSLLAVLIILRLLATLPSAQDDQMRFAPGELIVKFMSHATSDDRNRTRGQFLAEKRHTFRSGAEHWRIDAAADVQSIARDLRGNPLIEYAHPNWAVTPQTEPVIPNDPNFPQQWNLYNWGQQGGTVDADIDAEFAWEITKGSIDVVVAVLDSGVDYNQGTTNPELAVWTNDAEVKGLPNVDDDGCGYVDDTIGYDFGGDPADEDNDPFPHCGPAGACSLSGEPCVADTDCPGNDCEGMVCDFTPGSCQTNDDCPPGELCMGSCSLTEVECDGNEDCVQDTCVGAQPFLHCDHGTQVAGVLGAKGDSGRAIAGVSWYTRIMPVKIFYPGTLSPGFIADLIQGIDYATCHLVDVMNISSAVFQPDCPPPCSQALRDAIDDARKRDIPVVVAAGNRGDNIDQDPNSWSYPCQYTLNNIICVTSSDRSDQWGTDNTGAISVDLAAPGREIMTLKALDPNAAAPVSGSSFAAPHVSGVIALMRALSPDIPVKLIRDRLLDPNSLDLLDVFSPDPNVGTHPVATGGRLNAHKCLVDHDSVSPDAVSNLTASGVVCTNSINLTWTATADDGSTGDPATFNQVRVSQTSIADPNAWLRAAPAASAPVPAAPGTMQSMVFGGLKPSTTYYFRMRSFDEWGNGPMSNQVTTTTHALCTASYCEEEERRCYSTGCGPASCCNYTCFFDPGCAAPDPCPPEACNCN